MYDNYRSGAAAYTGRTVSEAKTITLVGDISSTNATTNIGIFKDGAWYLDNDGSGTWNAGDRANNFGAPGWTPLIGKWTGTGVYTAGTVSEKKTSELASETVSITANKDSVVRTRPFSVTITGSPNTWYNIWVRNTSNMDIGTYDGAPPIIKKFQEDVLDGDINTFGYKYQGGGGTDTVGMNAYGESAVWFQDPSYAYSYALIKTSIAGTRTVEFSTSQNTSAQMYTIRVERNLNDNNYAQGDFTGDEVGIIVNVGISGVSQQTGIYQDGIWYLDLDGSGTWNAGDRVDTFGASGWTPVLGDWNGDGKTETGVYLNGIWYLDLDGSGTWNAGDRVDTFGASGWTPVLGDWNGDGKTETGVYRNGIWYLDLDGSGTWNAGDRADNFGASGWTPVLGDWNGDGKTETGVCLNGMWYLDMDGSGTWNAGDRADNFGAPGWTPVLGDWNGDGKTETGVTNGQTWYLDHNGDGAWTPVTDNAYSFGAPGWTPIVGKWS